MGIVGYGSEVSIQRNVYGLYYFIAEGPVPKMLDGYYVRHDEAVQAFVDYKAQRKAT